MLPAAVDCPTRQPVSQLSAACQRFARETWNPWRRQAAASSDRCFTYETERTGIGNWLPILLDFAKAAADAGGALSVRHGSAQAFFLQLGVRFELQSPCSANASSNGSVPKSWGYDLSTGGNGPRRDGHGLYSCLFSLFTCPNASLLSRVAEILLALAVIIMFAVGAATSVDVHVGCHAAQ